MTALFKFLIKAGLVGAVLAGGTVLLAGPDRVGAMFAQTQEKLGSLIDDQIDDPVALRRQLHELEAQYPERISQVRGDLAELQDQITQLERERAVAERVVALASADLDTLEPQLAETKPSVAIGDASPRYSRIAMQVGQIHQTRQAYSDRATDAERDLGYLRQQAGRLEELLLQLETERAQFQSQLWQLDREIDTVARNTRLIDLMEKRQETIERCSRYKVASLDQLESRLSEIRTRQEAELQFLAEARKQMSYEEQARRDVEMGADTADVMFPTGTPRLR